jgi:hypothetical protein
MEDIEYAIQGWVENLRFQRRAAYVSGNWKKGVGETDIYSLPFDDELTQTEAGYDIEDFYNNAYKGGLN